MIVVRWNRLLVVVFTFLKINRSVFVAPSIRVSREIGNEMLGRGEEGGGNGRRERRYRFPGGGWWGIDDRIASTPAEPITRLNLRSPLLLCLPSVSLSFSFLLRTRHSFHPRRAFEPIFSFFQVRYGNNSGKESNVSSFLFFHFFSFF